MNVFHIKFEEASLPLKTKHKLLPIPILGKKFHNILSKYNVCD